MSNKLTAVPASKKKQRPLLLRFGTWVKFFLPMALIAFVLLARRDVSLNLVINYQVMALENATGRRLPFLHRIFDLKFERSQEELFTRVEKEDVYVVIMLMDNGVSADFHNDDGESPLSYALKNNKLLSVERLLLKGADPNFTNARGVAPLIIAARNKNMMSLRWLLHYKAEVDARDSDGKTALLHLSGATRPDLVRILLAAGANPDLQDKAGKSALFYAMAANDLKSVRELINKGASTEILDAEGRSVFSYVSSPEMSNTLRELGVEDIPDIAAIAESLAVDPEPSIEDTSDTARKPSPTTQTPKKQERSRKPMTRLRVVKQPEATWVYGKTVTLSSIEVTVRNVGGDTAENVKVEVEMPGGKVYLMIGPNALEPYASETYTATPSVTVDRVGKLKAKVGCSNCYR